MGDFDAAQKRLDSFDQRISALEQAQGKPGGGGTTKKTPSPDGTTVTNTTDTLVDDGGNTFQLTPGQQVTMNDNLRQETSRVTELKKVNGDVWQQTSFGGFWGWDHKANAWTAEAQGYPQQSTGTGGGSTTTGNPPKPAQDAGMLKLALGEPFDDPNHVGTRGSGAIFQQGLPWDGHDSGPGASTWEVNNSILTIHGPDRNLFFKDRFTYGCFYAKMWSRNWGSFWLMSANHILDGDKIPIDANNPASWNLEIDIREGDENHPNAQYSNYHRNTSGYGGMPDDMNQGQGSNPNGDYTSAAPIEGAWREICAVWSQQGVDYFLLEPNGQWIKTRHFDPYPSNGNACTIILTADNGGLHGGPTVDPQICMFDDVQVWTTG
jgi:hypothetical protein